MTKDDFRSDGQVCDAPSNSLNERLTTRVSNGAYFHGTEIEMVPTTGGGYCATIKLQTSRDESRNYRVTAPSQTALFELVKLVLGKEPR